jgi:hypothetical protein
MVKGNLYIVVAELKILVFSCKKKKLLQINGKAILGF